MLGSASELYHATREINAAHQAKAHPLKQSQEFEINVLVVLSLVLIFLWIPSVCSPCMPILVLRTVSL